MRKITPALTLLAACSFSMQTLPRDWQPDTEPQCDDSYGPVIADGLTSALLLGIASAAADSSLEAQKNGEESAGADGVAITGFLLSLGFVVSALVGDSNYDECRNAKAQWRIGAAIGAGIDRREKERRQPAQRDTQEVEREKVIGVPQAEQQPVAEPRGFFCASSPSNIESGFCYRDKSECEMTRDLSLAGIPDLSACGLVETAWCLDKLCFPTQEACRARSRLSPDGKCAEVQ